MRHCPSPGGAAASGGGSEGDRPQVNNVSADREERCEEGRQGTRVGEGVGRASLTEDGQDMGSQQRPD